MRTISLRRFRDSIASLDEPVEVTRRDEAGNYQIIGRWEPLRDSSLAAQVVAMVVETAEESPKIAGVILSDRTQTAVDASRVVRERSFAEFRPVPKPGSKR